MKASPNSQLLTYLAQVRQRHSKNGLQVVRYVFIKPPILPIKPNKKRGISHKEIAIIGTVRAADWVARNRNTGGWSRVVGNWRNRIHFTSLRSHAKGRK